MSEISDRELIARSGYADIYAWDEGQILKLYHDWVPAYGVEHEARIGRLVHEVGLPVPAVGEIIEVNGRPGLISERIDGGTMADSLLETPEVGPETVLQLARIFAGLQVHIHTHSNVPELPSLQQQLERVIKEIDVLPPNLKEGTLEALYKMPEGDCICHGDFHPYNVLMSPHQPVVIDWNNISIGNPVADVARSALILSGAPVSNPSLRSVIDQFEKAYLERYFELRPGGQEQLAAWQPVVAAVRLSDEIPELQEWLLARVRTGLALHD
jgi:uncharacterized protein (TIGR02172 family)